MSESARHRDREAEIGLVLSAFDCMLVGRSAELVAAPVSTGRRLMRLLASHGVCSSEELVEAIGPAEYDSKILKPNIEDGLSFAEKIRCSGRLHVIFTGPLYHPLWRFADYMEVCLAFVETRCHSVFFANDWEYSQGAVMELDASLRVGLQLHASDLSTMDLSVTAQRLKNARAEITQLRLDPSAWNDALVRLGE
jgi:hypothetical protein